MPYWEGPSQSHRAAERIARPSQTTHPRRLLAAKPRVDARGHSPLGEERETVSIIGRNGVGQLTLLASFIMGHTTPLAGAFSARKGYLGLATIGVRPGSMCAAGTRGFFHFMTATGKIWRLHQASTPWTKWRQSSNSFCQSAPKTRQINCPAATAVFNQWSRADQPTLTFC